METLIIRKPMQSRKFGWAWSATPADHSPFSIIAPTEPDFVGTVRQVIDHIANDRTFQTLNRGGTYTKSVWFYDGKRILNRDDLMDFIDAMRQPLPADPRDARRRIAAAPLTLQLVSD